MHYADAFSRVLTVLAGEKKKRSILQKSAARSILYLIYQSSHITFFCMSWRACGSGTKRFEYRSKVFNIISIEKMCSDNNNVYVAWLANNGEIWYIRGPLLAALST